MHQSNKLATVDAVGEITEIEPSIVKYVIVCTTVRKIVRDRAAAFLLYYI